MLKKVLSGLLCIGLSLGLAACSKKAEGTAPTVTSGAYGTTTDINFPGLDAPLSTAVSVLDEGDGEGKTVQNGDFVIVDYYGKVWKGDEITDSTIGKSGGPKTISLADPPVPGWSKLVGAKVGQRILLVMTASDAYGEFGSENLGIRANQAVVYVVDIIGTYSLNEAKDVALTPTNQPLPNGVSLSGDANSGYQLDATLVSSLPSSTQSVVYAQADGMPLNQDQIAVVQRMDTQAGAKTEAGQWKSASLSTLPVSSTGLKSVRVGSLVVMLSPATPSNPGQVSLVQVLGAYNLD